MEEAQKLDGLDKPIYRDLNEIAKNMGNVPDNLKLKETILTKADKVTGGDRNESYGNPRDNHQRTADLFAAYLHGKGLLVNGKSLSADDVCYLNILQKISRSMHDPEHEDTWVDIAGYARNLEMMREE